MQLVSPKKLTQSQLWFREALVRKRDKSIRSFFELMPPVAITARRSLSERVVVASERYELNAWERSDPQNLQSAPTKIVAAAREYGLHNPIFEHVSDVGWFWPTFFDAEDFLPYSAERSIPRLVITTGQMCGYDSVGMGNSFDVTSRLSKICEHWKIPLVVVTNPKTAA